MRVKIIKEYYDSTKNKELIKAGTEMSVSAERGKVLVDTGVAEEIKEIKEKKSTNKK